MDSAIVGDLQAAVVELHDRLQYRTNILGDATTSLAGGYNVVVENLGRVQQSLDAYNEMLTRLVQDNASLHTKLEQTRVQLEETRAMSQAPKLGRLRPTSSSFKGNLIFASRS